MIRAEDQKEEAEEVSVWDTPLTELEPGLFWRLYYAFWLCLPLLLLLEAWVLSWMWGWFIAPLGTIEIGVVHALGIVLITRILIRRDTTKVQEPDPSLSLGETVEELLFSPAMLMAIWLFGAVLDWVGVAP